MAEVVPPGYDAIETLLPVVSALGVLSVAGVVVVGLSAAAGWGILRR